MKSTYSMNLYDKDGDVSEECILIYTSDENILKFKDIEELKKFYDGLKRTIREVEAIYCE